jgi:hypothetical protein
MQTNWPDWTRSLAWIGLWLQSSLSNWGVDMSVFPSVSQLKSRKNFAFSASCRLSGKAMARTGLRMMPRFHRLP